jgi:hypothetical protein
MKKYQIRELILGHMELVYTSKDLEKALYKYKEIAVCTQYACLDVVITNGDNEVKFKLELKCTDDDK